MKRTTIAGEVEAEVTRVGGQRETEARGVGVEECGGGDGGGRRRRHGRCLRFAVGDEERGICFAFIFLPPR